jgi:hypothetical protein
MDSRSAATSRIHEEWSVTLDGRYLVRFRGVNARELATQQLHELAELLGFEDEHADGSAVRSETAPGSQRR